MTTKDLQKELVSTMRNWQQVENSTVALTGQVMEKTSNPIVRLIMEIIQRDSQMHYNVQEWIADSLEGKTVSLTPEEIGEVWGMIETHIEIEKKSFLPHFGKSKCNVDCSGGLPLPSFLVGNCN